MAKFTSERLVELRAVAEAANGSSDDQSIGYDDFGDLAVGKGLVLALIAALEAANESKPSNSVTSGSANERELADLRAELEAKTAEVDAKADYVSDLEERVRQRDNHVIPVLHARIKEAERERDEARAELAGLADDGGHKAAKYWKWWQREKARADRAEAAIERVKALHHDAGESQGYTPEVRGGYGMIPNCCASCGSFGEYGEPWPCPTVHAIEEETP